MNNLTTLVELMKADPAAFEGLSITKLTHFANYATLLERDILLAQSANHPELEPPPCQPDTIETFLERTCELPKCYGASCWDVFKWTIWEDSVSLQEHLRIPLVPLCDSPVHPLPSCTYMHIGQQLQPQHEKFAPHKGRTRSGSAWNQCQVLLWVISVVWLLRTQEHQLSIWNQEFIK